jgi:Coenzyme PQQ synthesis protein D (PqqD)
VTRSVRLRSDALEWREVEGEIVVLDLATRSYLAVSQTGAILWPSLAAGADASELTDLIVTRFGVSEERAAADVDAFIEELSNRGLLEPVS